MGASVTQAPTNSRAASAPNTHTSLSARGTVIQPPTTPSPTHSKTRRRSDVSLRLRPRDCFDRRHPRARARPSFFNPPPPPPHSLVTSAPSPASWWPRRGQTPARATLRLRRMGQTSTTGYDEWLKPPSDAPKQNGWDYGRPCLGSHGVGRGRMGFVRLTLLNGAVAEPTASVPTPFRRIQNANLTIKDNAHNKRAICLLCFHCSTQITILCET